MLYYVLSAHSQTENEKEKEKKNRKNKNNNNNKNKKNKNKNKKNKNKKYKNRNKKNIKRNHWARKKREEQEQEEYTNICKADKVNKRWRDRSISSTTPWNTVLTVNLISLVVACIFSMDASNENLFLFLYNHK